MWASHEPNENTLAIAAPANTITRLTTASAAIITNPNQNKLTIKLIV